MNCIGVCWIRTGFLLISMVTNFSCALEHFRIESSAGLVDAFPSVTYNHFEGGRMFTDVQIGLDLLWTASFKNKRPFKENIAFFVPGGLLILSNSANTRWSGRLNSLPVTVLNNKPFVFYEDQWMEILGIIHTHPDFGSLPMPAPVTDYQFCYTGIHNYIMDPWHLYDAVKDSYGHESYTILGDRSSYHKIPMCRSTRLSSR